MPGSVAVILAAGLGTRMKSARTKVLHEVAGRPLIVWAVENARAAGCSHVVAVLGHQHEQVQELLAARYGAEGVRVVLQTEQKGTGHAVLTALPALESLADDTIVTILSGDAPLLAPPRIAALTAACAESPAQVALLSCMPPITPDYGRLVRDDDGKLLRIVEHRDATAQQRAIVEVNAGFYAVQLDVLRAVVQGLTADNDQGELYLTDIAARAADRGGAAVLDVPYDEIRGVNDRADLAAVAATARDRINKHWLGHGVTMIAPEQTFIDADVGPIGADTVLGPGVMLRGATTIGANVRIDNGCVLDNVTLADNVIIKPHSVLTDTEVGEAAQIGPFTHCRPDTRIDKGAKVGNFVETKKTHLMAGAKANHLAYLGDASIGTRANIGAGTIMCNYDGFTKHRTVIEAGAFVGSDTQLVAPVTVGRDAYVGSGTTVTKDVPRGSLALSRSKQVNVEGWADRFRAAQNKRKGDKS